MLINKAKITLITVNNVQYSCNVLYLLQLCTVTIPISSQLCRKLYSSQYRYGSQTHYSCTLYVQGLRIPYIQYMAAQCNRNDVTNEF